MNQQIGAAKTKADSGDEDLRMGKKRVGFSETKALEDKQVCIRC